MELARGEKYLKTALNLAFPWYSIGKAVSSDINDIKSIKNGEKTWKEFATDKSVAVLESLFGGMVYLYNNYEQFSPKETLTNDQIKRLAAATDSAIDETVSLGMTVYGGVNLVKNLASKAGNAIKGSVVKRGSGNGFNKVPKKEYNSIRKKSVHNPKSDSITLGKYKAEGKSYIKEAKKTNSSYFDLGDDFGKIQKQYDLTNQEMFDYFNKPFIDDAINSGKTIKFSHYPENYKKGFLVKEWKYLKSRGYTELVPEGDVWIAK